MNGRDLVAADTEIRIPLLGGERLLCAWSATRRSFSPAFETPPSLTTVQK
jgi:hypothetical protein